jgi:putative addiction module component (TIGR02574 family)
MSIAFDRLKSELTTLSAQERAELAQFLIRTLDTEPEEEAEEAWEAEVMRRVDEIRAGTAQGKPAEQVFAELRAKYS